MYIKGKTTGGSKMKLYYQPDQTQGRVMHRIADAIKKYSPKGKIVWVKDYKEADLVIENIYGDHKTVRAKNNDEIMKHITEKPYGIFFHGFAIPKEVVKQNPFFKECFSKAKFIYSPWDLKGEYGLELNNFLRGAWGIEEGEFFKQNNAKKRFTIACTGSVAASEAIQEIYEACKILDCKMLHLGHNFGFDSKYYENRENVSVEEVNAIFNGSKYVSALRRAEGFELPAIEAANCGIRPICFNNPCYTHWFKDFAIFIGETDSVNVVDQLVDVLSHEPQPIAEEHRLSIRERFKWSIVCKHIWEFILGRI